jgi:hypothetical protein
VLEDNHAPATKTYELRRNSLHTSLHNFAPKTASFPSSPFEISHQPVPKQMRMNKFLIALECKTIELEVPFKKSSPKIQISLEETIIQVFEALILHCSPRNTQTQALRSCY